MPVLDGHDVCHVLRSEGDVPIIFLTARTTEDDLVSGLALGADDYITKPFSPRELVARVEAVLRRVATCGRDRRARAGSLVLDEARHKVTLAGRPVRCTPAEFRILRELVARPHRVFSRSRLLEAAFGFDHDALERTIDVHVMNLRRKLEPDPRHPRHLVTVYGVGYKYVADGDRGSARVGDSVVPGERRPVGVALLEELVAALLGLVGHVGQAGGLAGEELLADEAVVDQVEGVLQHPLGGRALAVDAGPTPDRWPRARRAGPPG